jgi:dTDP-L-rhamnose 4-epimerase
VFEDGYKTRDFTHVSDIVQANLLAMENDRNDYHAINIGTGVATSVLRVAELFGGWAGEENCCKGVGKYREGDIRHCSADISRAQ